MVESIETVIIGAGHAGLSTSYCLKQRGREHLVLEKASRPGNAWSSERWDSFTFVTPNWSFQIPGGEYDGPEPDGFMTREELVRRFEQYAEKYQLPIAYNQRVTAVQREDDQGYLVQTRETKYRARNVVIANGWFQVGKKPPFADKLPPSIVQLHSSEYRNPQSLPTGAVLVVGSGQSGGQIAEDLYQSGRKVFLATGTAPHAPRRYRGKDIFRWFVESGFANQTFEQIQFMGRSFVAPMISGKDGGHSLNLYQFSREGVILMGHAREYIDGKLIVAPDLKENLGKADMGYKFLTRNFNEYIQRAGMDAPVEEAQDWADGFQAPEITALDLQAEGIHTVIWASGYTYDASIYRFRVLNQYGLPDALQGFSQASPGLFFVGFPFQPSLMTGFVGGVAKTAANVAEWISSGRTTAPAIL